MAAPKGVETEYVTRKNEKAFESGSSIRKNMKPKSVEYTESSNKKSTRAAKSRVTVSEDTGSMHGGLIKAREKGRSAGDGMKDDTSPTKKDLDVEAPKKDIDLLPSTQNDNLIPSPKKDMVPSPKKEMVPSTKKETTPSPKKEVVPSLKKDMVPSPKKEVVPSLKKDMVQSTKKETTPSPKKEIVPSPKKDNHGTGVPKKDLIPVKKDLVGCGMLKKESEALLQPKKEAHAVSISKKEGEVLIVKNRKTKLKVYNTLSNERKKDDHVSTPKMDETKSEVTTSEKSKSKDDKLKTDRKEKSGIKLDGEKAKEIMNSDVTSSVDVSSKSNHSGDLLLNSKESAWNVGDLAWGRVGQHPFWPCMVAVDHQNGQFTKVKRVGRGVNAVQQSLHVQFFGDKGRHSWIPVNCVLKYKGKEEFLQLADKILLEMKKKDKKVSSAFIVKPASKPKWELAIKEAEESVPKAREERIIYFQELLPKRKTSEKTEPDQRNESEEKATSHVRKSKRSDSNSEEKPRKQIKLGKSHSSTKLSGSDTKKSSENVSSAKKKRRRNKSESGSPEY